MNQKLQEETYCESIACAGNMLAPFYLKDPARDVEALPLFKAIADIDLDAVGDEWPFADSGQARSSLGLMQRALPQGIPTDEVVWEYRRLFIGPDALPVPPWGSVYTDRDQVIFGESTIELRQWMRQEGIVRLGDAHSPEDHVGLMLGMMAWTAQNKPAVLEAFLQDHLLTWSGHYLELLESAARNTFYQGLARLTRSTLEGLQRSLQLSVTYPHYFR